MRMGCWYWSFVVLTNDFLDVIDRPLCRVELSIDEPIVRISMRFDHSVFSSESR